MADRITAYHAYRAAHQALFTAQTPQQCTAAARKVVENYRLNRLIWDEFNHYQKTGTILGNHPIFKVRQFMAEIKQLPVPEVIKKRNAIYKSIVVAQKQLRTGNEPHLAEKRKDIIMEKQPLLAVIDDYLKKL